MNMNSPSERQLLRSKTACASIVGLIEESTYTDIIEYSQDVISLSPSRSPATPSPYPSSSLVDNVSQTIYGGLSPDESSCGLAYIITKSDEGDCAATMRVWRQEIYAPSEDIVPDTMPVLELIHTDYPYVYDNNNMDDGKLTAAATQHDKHVVLVQSWTPKSSQQASSSTPRRYGYGYCNASQTPFTEAFGGMSVYWTSTNGTICHWSDLSLCRPLHTNTQIRMGTPMVKASARDNHVNECDVSLSLPLHSEEYVMCTVEHNSGGKESILVGTSQHRIFHVWKNARPLELQYKLLLARDEIHGYGNGSSSSGDMGNVDENDSPSKSYLGGLVNRLFTPAKPRRATNTEYHANDNEDGYDVEYDAQSSGIVGMFEMTLANTQRPIKSMKLTHPNPTDVSRNILYTVSKCGNVDIWTNGGLGSEDTTKHVKKVKFTTIAQKCLGRQEQSMKVVGATALNTAFESYLSDEEYEDAMNVDGRDRLSSDSASIFICMKVTTESDKDTVLVDKLFLVHLPIDTQTGRVNLSSCTCQWLDRYSSQAISSKSNPLICAGLVASRVMGGNITEEELRGRSTMTTVAYCVIQQSKRMLTSLQLPLTVSAVRLITEDGGDERLENTSQVIDIEMPSKGTQHYVIAGALQYDSATDGCHMICGSGLVTNVRAIFPSITAKSSMSNLGGGTDTSRKVTVSREKIEALAGHVHSAFQTHYMKQKANDIISPIKSPAYPRKRGLDSFLPQAIHAADNDTLGLAVVAVSAQLVNKVQAIPSDSSFKIHSSAQSRNGEYGSGKSPLDTIEKKWEMHNTFIKYLIRAGIYKRMSFKTKLSLRDHGEMIYSIGSMLNEWEQLLNEVPPNDDVLDVNRDSFMAEKRIIGRAMNGIEDSVTDFPDYLSNLFDQVIGGTSRKNLGGENQMEEDTITDFLPWTLLASLRLTYAAFNNAQQCRIEHSVQYDISESEEDGSMYHIHGTRPWTSSKSCLKATEHVLTVLHSFIGNEELMAMLQDTCDNLEVFVLKISDSLLDGYSHIPPTSRDESKYDNAKQISFDLVNLLCSEANGENKSPAFQMALNHAYFHGIVEICHEYSKHGQYDENFDLITLLQDCDADNQSSLQKAVDYRTGLCFQKYVFHWHCNRNLIGTVLDLGCHCPDALSQYMEEDVRLAHVRWVQNVKTGQFQKASNDLLGLTSKGITALGENCESLEDRQLVMSLTKLSAIAAGEDFAQTQGIHKFAEERLQLYKAQELLADMVDSDDIRNQTMDAAGLIKIALEVVKTNEDQSAKINACLIGLEIVKCMHTDDDSMNDELSSRMSYASKVWAYSILVDEDTWQELLEEWNVLSEVDQFDKLQSTVFCNVAKEYYSSADTKKNDELGFNIVREETMKILSMHIDANPLSLQELLIASLGICDITPAKEPITALPAAITN